MECTPVEESPPIVASNFTTENSSDYADNYTYNYDFNYDSSIQIYKAIEKIIYTKIILTICVFGIVGNILNLLILSQRSMTTRMERLEKGAHFGLIALALSDLMFCMTALPHTIKDSSRFNVPSIDFWLVYEAFGEAVVNTFILSSTWLTVAMAVSRYIAICYPLRARERLGLTSSRIVIVMVFLFR